MLDLRSLTPARVGLGRAGASLPTKALLEFSLDHARARDAVHAAFDVPAMISGLGDIGLAAFDVSSRVRDRKDYLRRPDLGRTLDPDSAELLASRAGSRVGLRSSSAMACRRRRSMLTRSNSSEASLGGWPPSKSRSVMPWWHRVRGSL